MNYFIINIFLMGACLIFSILMCTKSFLYRKNALKVIYFKPMIKLCIAAMVFAAIYINWSHALYTAGYAISGFLFFAFTNEICFSKKGLFYQFSFIPWDNIEGISENSDSLIIVTNLKNKQKKFSKQIWKISKKDVREVKRILDKFTKSGSSPN